MHCAACEADLHALCQALVVKRASIAELLTEEIEIQARIDAVLDGGHSDEVGGSEPVLEP